MPPGPGQAGVSCARSAGAGRSSSLAPARSAEPTLITTLRAPRAAASSSVDRSTLAEDVTPLSVTSMVPGSRPAAAVSASRRPSDSASASPRRPRESQPSPRTGRPADGRRRRPAHFDGHPVGPEGPGEGLHAGEGEVISLEVCSPARIGVPQGADGIDGLVRAVAPLGEVDTRRLDLFSHPAEPDSETEPSSRETVDGRGAFGENERMVHRKDEEAGGETQGRRDARHVGQRVEGVRDHGTVGQRHPPGFRIGIAAGVTDCHHHVLGQDQRLEAEPLGLAGQRCDPIGIREVGDAHGGDHGQGRRSAPGATCSLGRVPHGLSSWPNPPQSVGHCLRLAGRGMIPPVVTSNDHGPADDSAGTERGATRRTS